MDMIDSVANMVFTVIAAAALKHGWERLFPSDKSAADLGYMPGSEAPEGGWLIPTMLGVTVGGLLLFGPFLVARWLA